MTAVEIGRVCIKTSGRDAGNEVVIIDVKDSPYVVIEGANARRRRCNSKHLHFTSRKINIARNSSREEGEKKRKEQ